MGKKKRPKNSAPSKRWTKYKVQGNKLEKSRHCPKCGPGTFLAIHKDRVYCGLCSYTEFNKK